MIDNYKTLKSCRVELTDEDIQVILKKMPDLVRKIVDQRVLFDDVDFKGIPKAGNQKSRDTLKSISRKGYMFITDPKLLRGETVLPVIIPEVPAIAASAVLPVIAPPLAPTVMKKRVRKPSSVLVSNEFVN